MQHLLLRRTSELFPQKVPFILFSVCSFYDYSNTNWAIIDETRLDKNPYYSSIESEWIKIKWVRYVQSIRCIFFFLFGFFRSSNKNGQFRVNPIFEDSCLTLDETFKLIWKRMQNEIQWKSHLYDKFYNFNQIFKIINIGNIRYSTMTVLMHIFIFT